MGCHYFHNPGVAHFLIINNHSGKSGGGASGGSLYNCTISGNNANKGGGVNASILKNCIVYYNTAKISNNINNCTVSYSCSPELHSSGNISAPPQFVSTNTSNYRLIPDSSCIEAGNNAYAISELDLDGNKRIIGCRIDMGAYEYANVITGALMRVQPSEYTFGDVGIGEQTDMVITIENCGLATLDGHVKNVIEPFNILSGGSYVISACSQTNVIIRFAPKYEGTYSNDVMLTGGGSAIVMIKGNAVPEPAGMLLLSLIVAVRCMFDFQR